jgi:uncharacterized protein YbjT (DUF2867 family)
VKVLIVGATGLVGRHCLNLLGNAQDVSHITSLGRRTVVSDLPPHVLQHVVDLSDPDRVRLQIAEASPTVVFCTLGTTMKAAGSKAAFRAVDRDAVVRIAQAAYESGARRIFVVSSVGARSRSRFFYLRVKGEMEDAVGSISFDEVGFFRPSLILGRRETPRPEETVMSALSPLMRAKLRPLHARVIAEAMVSALKRGLNGRRVIHADGILALAGQLPADLQQVSDTTASRDRIGAVSGS